MKVSEMTNEIEDLARRAVACPRWRDMLGMQGIVPPDGLIGHGGALRGSVRVVSVYSTVVVCESGIRWVVPSPSGLLPDLADPATLGCLLALVREAWGDPLLHIEPEPNGTWRAWHRVTPMVGNIAAAGPTEAAAIVAALEAAPAREPTP